MSTIPGNRPPRPTITAAGAQPAQAPEPQQQGSSIDDEADEQASGSLAALAPDPGPQRGAAPRSEGLREDAGREAPRTRRRTRGVQDDRFAIPAHIQARMPGSTLEWKRESVYGKDDPHHLMALKENGWLEVQTDQLPGLMPEGVKGAIRRDGMVLMERPIELTREAEAEMRALANDQVRAQKEAMGQTPTGTLDRADRYSHSETAPRMRREYAALPVD